LTWHLTSSRDLQFYLLYLRWLIFYTDDFAGAFCIRSHQNGVIRFSFCRFLGMLLVILVLCNVLWSNAGGWPYHLIVIWLTVISQSITMVVDIYTAPLPAGWEKRSDAATGKTYYIDHSTRATTWNHPCPDKPWKRSAILSPLSQLANLFLLAGDIHATLYTGSKALHNKFFPMK